MITTTKPIVTIKKVLPIGSAPITMDLSSIHCESNLTKLRSEVYDANGENSTVRIFKAIHNNPITHVPATATTEGYISMDISLEVGMYIVKMYTASNTDLDSALVDLINYGSVMITRVPDESVAIIGGSQWL